MNKYVEQVREIAISNKYTKYYCNIIEKSLLRTQDRKYLKSIYGYVESHHILPQCFNLGGQKDKENLVFLTAKEHFIVHLCATKMFASNFKNKMVFAFRQLRSSNKYQNRYMNSKLYAQIKPNFKTFVRLYNKEEVKYIYESDIQIIEQLIREGWSRKMTDEFKIGRVGNMAGKKHSEESRLKMSIAATVPKPHLRGIKRSPETIQKLKDARIKFKQEHPEEYLKMLENRRNKAKQMHQDGIFNSKGEENPMFGRLHSLKAKELMRRKREMCWDRTKNDPMLYENNLNHMRISSKKAWDNTERHQMAKIFNSKAYQKYRMTPQEFYDKRLKPLLYLGFLPASIVQYNLINMCKGSIKRLVYTFGSDYDKKQFEINKKNIAGCNNIYIKFLDNQYNNLLKDKDINTLDLIEFTKVWTSEYLEKAYQDFAHQEIKLRQLKSIYRGVERRVNKWRFSFQYRNVNYIGSFNTEIEAAIAYDKKTVECLGVKARTNFPIENYINKNGH